MLLLRIPKESVVRVRYPDYAVGLTGVIQSREKEASRWIIQLTSNFYENSPKPVILSLELWDFEIVELPSLDENSDEAIDNE